MFKYLFTAFFNDGTYINQAENDISVSNPDKSSFFDVLEKEKTSPLELFCISDGQKTFLVNLKDGSFEIDGTKFYLHNTENQYFNRRVIYFRRNTINFNVGFEELNRSIMYKIGWQGNDIHGNNAQFIIEVP